MMNNIDVALLKTIPEVCPAFQARATARAITRYYNACFRPFELTAEQFSLLVGIGGSPNETVAELAARAGVDATTLSRNIRSLESRGIIDSAGGRGRAGKRLTLTGEGGVCLRSSSRSGNPLSKNYPILWAASSSA